MTKEINELWGETFMALCDYGARFHDGNITQMELTDTMSFLIQEWEDKAARCDIPFETRMNKSAKLRRKMARVILDVVKSDY